MTKKRIFVLNGHPAETSLVGTLAQSYADAAQEAGHEVRIVHLNALKFDMDFEFTQYEQAKPLEPCLEEVLEHFSWCEHVVLASPMWWGGMPAKLKAVFDRSFLPGRTFSTQETNFVGIPKPLLTGKSARVIITGDFPGFYMHLFHKAAMYRQIRNQIFGFTGIKPTKLTYFSPGSKADAPKVEKWTACIAKLGRAAQ